MMSYIPRGTLPEIAYQDGGVAYQDGVRIDAKTYGPAAFILGFSNSFRPESFAEVLARLRQVRNRSKTERRNDRSK